MIIIRKRKAGLNATQKWFSNKIKGVDCLSITIYKQVDFEIRTSAFFFTELFYTLHSDLTLSDKEILKKFSSTIRNEIKRSEREGCVFNSSESKENFILLYNDFAKQREIAGLTIKKLTELNDNLILTSTSVDGVITAVHSYLVDYDQKKVRLLHSGTQRFSEELDRNMIARSNKFLHYMDMIKFNQDGFRVYDWGGIAFNTQDKGLQGINKFKESFGGELVKQKELYSPLYYLILKLFK
jgi:hypothetical protein